MKQIATNTANDGLNFDLHPIVTPNSVLTDNLNGTFITYNGNEFCLQNDRGNVLKATLTEDFVPIGIKEHNGVLYIVSCKYDSRNKRYVSEIGTYPGIEWPDTYGETEENVKIFLDKYTPLKTLVREIYREHTDTLKSTVYAFPNTLIFDSSDTDSIISPESYGQRQIIK